MRDLLSGAVLLLLAPFLLANFRVNGEQGKQKKSNSEPPTETTRILIFHCPECNKAIPAPVDLADISNESTKPVRLVCAIHGGAGCGWIGDLPASSGKPY
jgi:hypothetical protein